MTDEENDILAARFVAVMGWPDVEPHPDMNGPETLGQLLVLVRERREALRSKIERPPMAGPIFIQFEAIRNRYREALDALGSSDPAGPDYAVVALVRALEVP